MSELKVLPAGFDLLDEGGAPILCVHRTNLNVQHESTREHEVVIEGRQRRDFYGGDCLCLSYEEWEMLKKLVDDMFEFTGKPA
jgi:hypothetical protein